MNDSYIDANDMQMGGFTLHKKSTADGMLQTPSPLINPDAIAAPYISASVLFRFSHTYTIGMHMHCKRRVLAPQRNVQVHGTISKLRIAMV